MEKQQDIDAYTERGTYDGLYLMNENGKFKVYWQEHGVEFVVGEYDDEETAKEVVKKERKEHGI